MSKKSMNVEVLETQVEALVEEHYDEVEVKEPEVEVDPLAEFGPTIVQVKKINMPKTVKTGVGARCMELIKTGEYTTKEIVEIVNKENELRKTTYACVAWYKNDMKKKGIVIG